MRMSAFRAFALRNDGIAAVEFAMVVPIFLLVLAGTVDLSGVLYTKFRLNSAVTAAAQYALGRSEMVSAGSGSELAGSLVSILTNSNSDRTLTASAIINNGPSASASNGTVATSGTASNADTCYCPSYSASGLIWGSSVACKGSCPSGATSGRYVSVTVSRPHTALFASWGVVTDGTITAQAAVRAE